MTIAEALCRVAPPAAAETDDEARVREAALEIVYIELHRLARSRVGDRSEAEDIASGLAYQIATASPGGSRAMRISIASKAAWT